MELSRVLRGPLDPPEAVTIMLAVLSAPDALHACIAISSRPTVMRKNYIAGPAALKAWVGEGPTLSDDNPLITCVVSIPKDDPLGTLDGLSGHFEEVLRP